MKKQNQNFDVIISGFGPVGSIMAILLAKEGHKVAIFERWEERYSLPRAVCIDHEMIRMLRTLGLGEKLNNVTHAGGSYNWLNADWKPLVEIDWGAPTISQESNVNFVHQPSLEKILEEKVRTFSNIELFLGYEVIKAGNEVDQAYLCAKNLENDQIEKFYAKYLIGADGANSLIRKAITPKWVDKGFEADWLVIDIFPHPNAEMKIVGRDAIQLCDPKRPTTVVPGGQNNGQFFRRWEFMRLPHETKEEMQTEAKAWELLSGWIKPEQATLIRSALYTFRSLIAEEWRNNRILIAGDAGHVMPPFMGQGMCAGFRDAWNLSWKLNGVLKGQFTDDILDTYMVERKPHVSDVIDLSMYLGRVICVPDEIESKKRDESFFNGTAEQMDDFPVLTDGLISKKSQFNTLAGHIAPHGIFNVNGENKRLDSIANQKFVLLTSKPVALNENQKKLLVALDCEWVPLAQEDVQTEQVYQELDQNIAKFMHEHQVEVILVRPDFYIYATATQAECATDLLENLTNDLAAYALKTAIKDIAS